MLFSLVLIYIIMLCPCYLQGALLLDALNIECLVCFVFTCCLLVPLMSPKDTTYELIG